VTGDREPTHDYAIEGGAAEEHRLAVLSQIMSGPTTRLFEQIGVGAGWNCLDVGSGGGQVSLALAGLVAPGGTVTGVDLDGQVLSHATAAARAQGVTNVVFERADAYALPYRDHFDLAYARLVLCYLTEPVTALRQLAAAVSPGGVVAVEDLFTDTLRSDPATPALDDLRRVYGATVRAHGGDPTIGPRLPAMFRAAGLTDVRSSSVVNVLRTPEEKGFLVTLVDSMRSAAVDSGAASADELDAVRAALEAAAENPECTVYQARIHEVYGVRASA
jgi:ubiquinone/menaquinone biosynthesis C-methylase UbiE